MKESEVFHGVTAAAATTLFISQFHPEEVRQASNWMRANLDWLSDRTIGVAREMICGQGSTDSLPPMTNEERKQVLQAIARAGESLKADKETMQQVRDSFVKKGNELSDTLSAQITAMLDHIDAVSGELGKALPAPATESGAQITAMLDNIDTVSGELGSALPAPATESGAQAAQQSASGQGSRLNMDFVYKLILTGLTGALAATVVYQIWNEPMGRGDWIADGVAITWAMAALHLYKQNSSRQDAQRDFTDLAGLTSVVAIFLALDKQFNYLHGDIGKYAAGASAMAAANLTVPGAIASTASSLLDAGLNALTRRKPDAAPNPADDVPATPGEAFEMDILDEERANRGGGHDGEGMQARTSDDIV